MQSMNLLSDPWIPVRHRSGTRVLRAPWDLFGPPDDPIVALASPRPDFDGALSELLIGLLYAVMQPDDEDTWHKYFDSPPDADALRAALEPLIPAFDLLGGGARYQQDRRVAAYGGDTNPAEKLLIDLGLSPGADHFARNGSVGALCLPCTAAAVTTLQAYAPTGGRGHMTSLRGGGPLTTLAVPVAHDEVTSLWHRVWLNVVPRTRSAFRDLDLRVLGDVFPWQAETPAGEPTRIPEKTPEDTHPLQVFFGMPRRLWLGNAQRGSCGVCGRVDVDTVAGYQTRPNGIRYAGAWRHPLSPHRLFKKEAWLPAKGDAAGIGYRHWLGLVCSTGGNGLEAALAVRELADVDRYQAAGGARLHAFGYAMDNMKARAWSDGFMPIFYVPPSQAKAFAAHARALIEGAKLVESYLRLAVKMLIARRPKDVKRDLVQVATRFWESTETDFYDRLRSSIEVASSNDDLIEQRQRWLRELRQHTQALFEIEVGPTDFRTLPPRQVATAWNDLQKKLFGPKIYSTLGLTKPAKRVPKGATA